MATDDPFRAGSLNHPRMWENYLSDENGFWLVAQIAAWFSYCLQQLCNGIGLDWGLVAVP